MADSIRRSGWRRWPAAAGHPRLRRSPRAPDRRPQADQSTASSSFEHSVEIYAALIAALAAAIGIWLGRSLRRRKVSAADAGSAPAEPFEPDESRLGELGITPRELEILGLIAAGLSNREIADRLFVSENTVKTHASRLFDKLGAKRRTQAVQLGKTARLIR